MTKFSTSLSALALLLIPATVEAQDVSSSASDIISSDIAADAPDAGGKGFPVRFSTGISNSVGNGILGRGFIVPSWSTSVPLSMGFRLPEVDFLPRLSLSAGTSVGIAWLSTPFSGNGGAGDRIARIGDLSLGLGFGGLWKEPILADQPWSKLDVGGRLTTRLPLALSSRTANIAAGVGLGLTFSWSTAQLEFMPKFMPISISYSPSLGATAYTETSGSIPCDTPPDFLPGLFGTGDPAEDLVGIPIRIPRAKEILPNGECRLEGRQSLANLRQSVSVGTRLLNHRFGISFGYGMAFLRPLGGDPGLSSPNATKQNFTDFTSGSISYGYDIPDEALGLDAWGVDTDMNVVLSSGQPAYTFDGKYLRFPFWDFISPQNNFSSLSVSLGASF